MQISKINPRARSLQLLSCVFACALTQCKSRTFGDGNGANGQTVKGAVRQAFEADASRGRGRVTLRSPGGTLESCLLPKHFPGVTYAARDAAEENALCALDFYAPAPKGVALCPDTASRFPRVNVFPLNGVDKQAFELDTCKDVRKASPSVATFAPSVSCSFVGATLAAYHLSRILGLSGMVPAAVVRTMDVREHKKLADRGVAWSTLGDFNAQLWKQLRSFDVSPSARPSYFTPDLSTVYGALSSAHSNPAALNEPFVAFNATRADGAAAKAAFLAQPAVRRVFEVGTDIGTSAQNSAGKPTVPTPVQTVAELAQLQDASALVVFDYLLQQQDRFGSIGSREEWIFQDASGSIQTRDTKPAPELGAVAIKRIFLADNACATRPGNARSFTIDDVRALRHLDPSVYARLRFLAKEAQSGRVEDFFQKEALMGTTDALGADAGAPGFALRIRNAAAALEENCRKGTLRLDLSPHARLKAESSAPAANKCDALSAAQEEQTLSLATKNTVTESSRTESPPTPAPMVTSPTTKQSTGTVPDSGTAEAATPKQCTVGPRGANLRKHPRDSSAVSLRMSRGRVIDITGFQNGWYLAVVGGRRGYVKAQTLEEPCKALL